MPTPSSSRGLAIVTGASAGIGQELARELSRRGHPVLAVARRLDRLQALADELAKAGGAPVHPFSADLLDPDAPAKILARARELGGVHWLVNNAGIVAFGAFEATTVEQNVRQVRLNCEALVAMTHAVLPELISRKGGVILNVASLAGFQSTPFMTTYGATKAFVLSFTEGLYEEVRAHGISLTALCPGPVETELFEVSAPGVKRHRVAGELSARETAIAGIDAAERGAVIHVPGAMNTVKSWGSKLMPRGLVRRTMGKMGLTTLGLPRQGK